MLSARGLVKHFGKWRVLDRVDVEVQPGEIVGLLGPNGAGKTTTFYLLVGLLTPDGGSITLNGQDVTGVPIYRRARLGLGYLAQEASVFRRLTVRDNVLGVLEVMGIPAAERRQRLEELLAELGIAHLADRKGYNLSGGERRKVEIARALAVKPSILLLDEPFVGIDPITVADIQDIVVRLSQKGIGILITDHNVREMLSTTDRAYLLFEGKIRVQGTSRELAEDPWARKVYLGERFSLP
ncbi:MAG TPA: LPS export ABC transporter ATP-binding protein [Candidatus Saccharimonadales bacterium]|nr:LPS export ABC transporter ATP-binding protein [Candidatus Saccharimonadales bacterium]